MPSYNGSYSVPSPWTSMKDLEELWKQGDPKLPMSGPGDNTLANIQELMKGSQPNSSEMNYSYDPSMMPMSMTAPSVSSNPLMNPNASGGSGGVKGPNYGDINKLLKQMEDQRTASRGNLSKGISDLEALGSKYPKEAQSDLTGLMMLANAFGGDNAKNFTNAYKRPPSQEELDKARVDIGSTIQKLKGELSDDELKSLQAQMTGEVAKLHYGQQDSDKKNERQTMADEKAAIAFEKELAADKASGRSPLGGAGNRIYAAQRMEALLGQYPDPNDIPPQMVSELAISLNSLLAPGNPNVTTYEHIVPKSARGSAASIENWLMNNPGGANQGEFIHGIAKTVSREKDASQKQVQDYIKTKAGASKEFGWSKRNPDLLNHIVGAHLNSPVLQGAPSPSAPSGYDDPEKEKRYQEWKAQQK